MGPTRPASYSEWAFSKKRSNLAAVGLRLPYEGGVLYRFDPPRTFSACTALTQGDAKETRLPNPKKVIMELHVDWGPASAHPLERVSVDSDMGAMGLVNYVDGVSGQREI